MVVEVPGTDVDGVGNLIRRRVRLAVVIEQQQAGQENSRSGVACHKLISLEHMRNRLAGYSESLSLRSRHYPALFTRPRRTATDRYCSRSIYLLLIRIHEGCRLIFR